MLRAGIARRLVERFLGGCALVALLGALQHRFPVKSLDDALKMYYAPMVSLILNHKSPLLEMLRKGKAYNPPIGRWLSR